MLHFSFVKRLLVAFLAMLLVVPIAQAAQIAQQPDGQSSPAQNAQAAQTSQQDSPAPNAAPSQSTPQPAQPDAAQPNSEPLQTGTTSPVGTAAAPTEKPVGATGSEPAGAAIAPAKQRRVRRILISVGAIVGGAIAIGTVAALSHGSPSRAH